MATQAALSTLDEVRAWATDPDNFRSGFSTYTSAPVIITGYERYPVTVEVGPLAEARSPCKSFCDDFGARGKTIAQALRAVRVSVDAWPGRPVVLNSYLGEPGRKIREVDGVRVTRVGGPGGVLLFQDTIRVKAEAVDEAGQPLEDLTFTWSVIPDSTLGDPGAGTFNFDLVNRRRDEADFTHVIYKPGPIWPGDPVAQGGRCRLRATARTYGGSRSGELVVDLQP